MSYGLRNTLILLVVLFIFIGAGVGYIYFYQIPKINDLEGRVDETQKELSTKQQIADRFPTLKNRYEKSEAFFNNYNKALYGSNNEDVVYNFLDEVNNGSAFTDFTFSFTDSTQKGQYGLISMKVTGKGYYRNFINFVRQVELSKPLNKVSNLSISPINELESYGKVNFNFDLKSYYDRARLLGDPDLAITNNLLGTAHNPFFPLIRSVKGNKNNLVNISKSKLIAISTDEVFMISQTGKLEKVGKGDEVYLGTLTSINADNGTATFNLNKGGIVEKKTLQINNDEEKKDGGN